MKSRLDERKSLKENVINKNNEMPTIALIHCGFVPHQNMSINQRLITKWNNPADDSTMKSNTKPLANN